LFVGDLQQFYYCICAIVLLVLIEVHQTYNNHAPLPYKSSHWLKEHLVYAVFIILILMLGVFDGGQFIYFQF
jgi:hypothetical protein